MKKLKLEHEIASEANIFTYLVRTSHSVPHIVHERRMCAYLSLDAAYRQFLHLKNLIGQVILAFSHVFDDAIVLKKDLSHTDFV